MYFSTDQNGWFVVFIESNSYLRFFDLKVRDCIKKLLLGKIFFFSNIFLKIFSWETRNTFQKYFVSMYFLDSKNLYSLNSRKKKITELLPIKKIDSICNYKNLIYIVSELKLYIYDTLSSQFSRIFNLTKILSEKIDTKIERSYNGKFLLISNKFFFIFDCISGFILRKILKKKNFPLFFGLINKNFMLLGGKNKNVDFWNVKKNFFYSALNISLSAKKKSFYNYTIKEKHFLILTCSEEKKIFSFFFFNKDKEKKKNLIIKTLQNTENLMYFDFLKKTDLILLTSSKGKMYPFFLRSKNFPFFGLKPKIKKKKVKIFFCKKKEKIDKILNNCVVVIKEKEKIYKKKNFFFEINYKIYKKKKFLPFTDGQFYFSLNFFMMHKNINDLQKNLSFTKSKRFFFNDLISKILSSECFLNFFLKKLNFQEKKIFNFISWIKDFYNSFFVWISNNKLLNTVLKKFKKILSNLNFENSFTKFSFNFSNFLNEILNFENFKK